MVPLAGFVYADVRRLPTTAVRNREMRKLQQVLARRTVLSFVPSVTQLTSEQIVTEPFLLSHLNRLGKYDLHPLENRIRNQEFGVVVTSALSEGWRGIPHVAL